MNTVDRLEAAPQSERLVILQDAMDDNTEGIRDVAPSEEVNNHVHTHYSFSPYTPSSATYMARKSGLMAVGSVDHDSIGAAVETRQAAAILGMGSTSGAEFRVSFAGTPFGDRRLNNPDSVGVAYMVMHGVPHRSIDQLKAYIAPLQAARAARNREQTRALSAIVTPFGLHEIDYDQDVLPLSWANEGGSVTERHILYALARRAWDTYGQGEALMAFLESDLEIGVSDRQRRYLLDPDNPHVLYDLLGVFKGEFLGRFFVQPDESECRPVREVTELAQALGAIPAYAYLGDVGDSPTGDKAAQAFEDAFLEELVAALPDLGFQAVTYMPPRNTPEQLRRFQRLAAAAGLLEISGVDINSSRQVFTCPEVMMPEFQHLTGTTWALIAHEHLSDVDPRYGLFHPDNPIGMRPLSERVGIYAGIARRSDMFDPGSMKHQAPDLPAAR